MAATARTDWLFVVVKGGKQLSAQELDEILADARSRADL